MKKNRKEYFKNYYIENREKMLLYQRTYNKMKRKIDVLESKLDVLVHLIIKEKKKGF